MLFSLYGFLGYEVKCDCISNVVVILASIYELDNIVEGLSFRLLHARVNIIEVEEFSGQGAYDKCIESVVEFCLSYILDVVFK